MPLGHDGEDNLLGPGEAGGPQTARGTAVSNPPRFRDRGQCHNMEHQGRDHCVERPHKVVKGGEVQEAAERPWQAAKHSASTRPAIHIDTQLAEGIRHWYGVAPEEDHRHAVLACTQEQVFSKRTSCPVTHSQSSIAGAVQ